MDTLRAFMTLLWRGILLRCPVCGRGRLFQHGYTMFEHCSVCGWTFEREEGYWTGAMGVNLVVTELIVAFTVVPLSIMQVPMLPLLAIGLPATAAMPFIFYRHSKSMWMAIDFMLHPIDHSIHVP